MIDHDTRLVMAAAIRQLRAIASQLAQPDDEYTTRTDFLAKWSVDLENIAESLDERIAAHE